MAELIFPDNFDEKCTIAQDDYILMADSEDWNKIKKAKYSFLKWEKWDTGEQWPQGEQWIQWEQGVQWEQGPQGCQGIQWEQWIQGEQWPQWCKWDTGNGISCAILNPDYTLTLQYTNWCCDTTWSIRGEQGPQGCQWPQWCTWEQWPAWNWICCTTCTKVWKETTVQLDYTDWTSFCFKVQDGQDWQWAWDMLKCVYDPNGCESDAFNMDNMEQWTTNKFVSVGDINNWNWKASVIWFPNGTTKAQINTILSWLDDLQQVLFSTANATVTRAWLWNTAPNAAIKWIITKYTSTESVHILAHTYNGDVFTVAYKYSNWTLLSSIEYKQTQLTTAQLNAVNSGITSEKVSTYDWYATSKQDKIDDLDTIRAWAACWASALQSINCWDVTTALWYTPTNYADFETATTVWATLTVSFFTTQITPSTDFTIVAWTVKEWMQYIVRVNSWATAYAMSLWTWVTNPFGEDLTLTANKMTTIVMLATSSSTLEIFSILTAE